MDLSSFVKMDDESFIKLSTYITREYGIKLPAAKKTMVESRLHKKVKHLGFENYKIFLDYLFSREGKKKELLNVVDLITTNKTDFFREPTHFQFLTDDYLESYIREHGYRNLKIWSAGCSTGEEPYTILIVLEEFKKMHTGLNYSILASDISTRVIQTAYQGIYHENRIENIPLYLKRDYFLKSNENSLVRIKPSYRKKIFYKRINLMESFFGPNVRDFDIIFCRNVLIYFDKPTQEKVINKLSACLRPGGVLLLGHSESVMGMNVPLKQIKPTIYQLPHEHQKKTLFD